jgi:hypothetical protein
VTKQQATITGGQGYDHMGVYDNGYALLQIGPSNKEKKIILLSDQSYAQDIDGTRYKIETEPHEFDIQQEHKYIRDRIYILNETGKKKRSISSGDWRFFFTFQNPDGTKDTREFTGQYWKFYYNPIIHGPPN